VRRTITFILLVASATTFSFVTKNDGREGHTGSPGETTCNTSGCHTGNPVNDPSGSILINAPTMTGWQYQPGVTYPIEVTVTRSGNQKFGIGFEALQTSGANGGTLSITNGTETQLKNAFVSGNSRTNVVHKTNGGLGSDSKTFAFNWTAAATAIGNITFYVAGIAANGNNGDSGDFVFTSNRIITPATGVSVQELPALSEISVISNPVSESIEIRFENQEPIELTFSLYSINGSKIISFEKIQYSQGINTFKTEVDETIPSGVYYLNITDGTNVVIRKITIIK